VATGGKTLWEKALLTLGAHIGVKRATLGFTLLVCGVLLRMCSMIVGLSDEEPSDLISINLITKTI